MRAYQGAIIAGLLLMESERGDLRAQAPVFPSSVPQPVWLPAAPALPPARGEVVPVATVEALLEAVEAARPGQTILLADGCYRMPRYAEIHTDSVTLRSASGDRQAVVLDGAESRHGELLGIAACRGVTIADVTIQNARWNGFKINSDRNVQGLTIRNCVIHNIWQRGVKGVSVPPERREEVRPRGCRVEHCLFYNDRPKRYGDDETDTPATFGGNYIAGIDVMYATDWTISDNVFVGIHGRTGEGPGAVFVWVDARGCTIERNCVIDCDAGISLGNAHRGEGVTLHATGCVVRNNFVTRAPENGLFAAYTRGCRIVHNTVHDPGAPLQRLIRVILDNDDLVLANNLLSGPPLQNLSSPPATEVANWTGDAAVFLADPQAGDLHLKTAAASVVDAADAAWVPASDFDGQGRAGAGDIGADELDEGYGDGRRDGPADPR